MLSLAPRWWASVLAPGMDVVDGARLGTPASPSASAAPWSVGTSCGIRAQTRPPGSDCQQRRGGGSPRAWGVADGPGVSLFGATEDRGRRRVHRHRCSPARSPLPTPRSTTTTLGLEGVAGRTNRPQPAASCTTRTSYALAGQPSAGSSPGASLPRNLPGSMNGPAEGTGETALRCRRAASRTRPQPRINAGGVPL